MADEAQAQLPSDNLVAVRDLTREYKSSGGLFSTARSMRAVNKVSLDVPRGKVTGVVGESGCGKSTLARLVLRLIEPTAGRVLFNGADLASLAPAQLRKLRCSMQMVFQDPYSAIDPRYTIRRALLEPFEVQGVALGKGEQEDRLIALISKVGLSPRMIESYPHQLSGGKKQRVGIARALALSPSFLVLDEPTASLDVSIQAQIIGLLEALKQDLGLTYLFISHDLSLVRYFCDRIVVMYLGRVVEILPGARAEARHHYARTLMDSHFVPDPKHRKAVTLLVGEIPSPFNLPPGCAFAERCPAASPLCQRERPLLSEHATGHLVACHHPA